LTPKENTLKAFHFKDETKKEVYIKKQQREGYKEIITKYKVLSEQAETSLVEVHLITGRTHQIRAHFAYIGHPLIGDGKYGKNEINKKFNAKYQYLYSYKLNFDIKDKENPLYYLNEKNFEIEEDYVKRLFETN
jgi:23S rRNA pseudouridine955/2504/2580 synthase